MNEQEALEAFFVEWDRQANEYGASLTREQRDCAEEAWNAALAWLRSQGEPVLWQSRWLDTHPHTAASGEWSDWEEVKPRNPHTDTVADRVAELKCYIERGYKYEVRPLFLAPQPAILGDWQPIETVPKDFEPFDVWSARHGRIPDCADGVTTYGKRRGIVFQSGYDSDGPVMDLIEDATHWMRVAAPEPSK